MTYPKLTIVNPKGLTVRIGPNTGAGVIRTVKNGALEYAQILPAASNGDIWAMLSPNDPETKRPWRYSEKETFAFCAVYVGGVTFVTYDATPPTAPADPTDYNRALDDAKALIETLRK